MMRPASKSISASDLDKINLMSEQSIRKDQKRKVVFLDKDGTINVDKGYIINPQQIELTSKAGEAIASLNRQGIPVIVITNQAAIGKRLLTIETFEKINEKLWSDLQDFNAYYNALYYCPHNPEIDVDCLCRKPRPGLILQAAKDFNADLSASFMIGDKLTDIIAGQRSGCKTVLLLDGHGKKQEKLHLPDGQPSPDFICDTLADAIDWILTRLPESSDL
jgi:D-glycero-D-manno-heptose 1,7-bisphosphate phosphatase